MPNNLLSIAVLPFVNISDNTENEHFNEGLTEEIINNLSKIGSLKVISRTSSFFFKGKKIGIKEIGEQLNVQVILEGSIRVADDQVRISIRLINAKDGFQYWSENYDHHLVDIFYIQDQIASQVAEKMREHIGHFNFEEAAVIREENTDAYEFYLRSRFNFNKFQKEDVLLALQQIDLAIKIDATNSRYFASKAIYCGYLAIMDALPFKVAFKIAKEAAEKALLLNSLDPEAHYAMLVLAFVFEWDIDKAQHHGKQALVYRPNYPDPLFAGSLIEIVSQNYDIAEEGVRKAIMIDPLSPSMKYYYAAILVRLNKLEEALNMINEGLELAPTNTNSYQLKGIILTRLGEYEKALAHYDKVPTSPNKTIRYNAGIGIVYATMGNKEKAIEYLKKIKEEKQQINVAYEENALVIINTLLGNFDEAFKYVKEDVKNKKYYLKFYRVHPVFNLLKKDPRYALFDTVFLTKGKKTETKKKKYVKSGIKEKELEAINNALMELMATEKPYLNPKISLKALANKLARSSNHVSQVINDKHNVNFFDFVNDYRIHEMTDLLKRPANKRFTLLALAEEAGFNSKTTFNAAFKKLKGTTPRKYFKELQLI
jgi:TolB-like protein/AraC-like DNA-binding protein